MVENAYYVNNYLIYICILFIFIMVINIILFESMPYAYGSNTRRLRNRRIIESEYERNLGDYR